MTITDKGVTLDGLVNEISLGGVKFRPATTYLLDRAGDVRALALAGLGVEESGAALDASTSAERTAVLRRLLTEAEATALRQHYWRRYGATLQGLMRHHDIDLGGVEARILEGELHGVRLPASARLRRRRVVPVGAGAHPEHPADGCCASFFGMLGRLQHEPCCAFAEHDALPGHVEGEDRSSRVRFGCLHPEHAAGDREDGDEALGVAHGRRVAAAAERHVDPAQGEEVDARAQRIECGCAGGGHRPQRSVQLVADGDLGRGHVGLPGEHGLGRDPVDPLSVEAVLPEHDAVQPSRRRAVDHGGAQRVERPRSVESGSLERLVCGDQGVLGAPVGTGGDALAQDGQRIEPVGDRRGEERERGVVRPGRLRDAERARVPTTEERVDADADRRHRSGAGDGDGRQHRSSARRRMASWRAPSGR